MLDPEPLHALTHLRQWDRMGRSSPTETHLSCFIRDNTDSWEIQQFRSSSYCLLKVWQGYLTCHLPAYQEMLNSIVIPKKVTSHKHKPSSGIWLVSGLWRSLGYKKVLSTNGLVFESSDLCPPLLLWGLQPKLAPPDALRGKSSALKAGLSMFVTTFCPKLAATGHHTGSFPDALGKQQGFQTLEH